MATEPTKSGNEETAPLNNAGNETTSTLTDGQAQQVTMSQDDLNHLINGKFKKGADRATSELLAGLGVESVESLREIIEAKREAEDLAKTEVEKLTEQLATLNTEKLELVSSQAQAAKQAALNRLAVENGVTELDYFSFEYASKSQLEDFNVEEFINDLKSEKPFVFGQKQVAVKTDSSSNGGSQPSNFSDRVKLARTKQELDALYAELD